MLKQHTYHKESEYILLTLFIIIYKYVKKIMKKRMYERGKNYTLHFHKILHGDEQKKTFIFSFVTQFSNVHQMCVCVMCDEKKMKTFWLMESDI